MTSYHTLITALHRRHEDVVAVLLPEFTVMAVSPWLTLDWAIWDDLHVIEVSSLTAPVLLTQEQFESYVFDDT